MDLLQAVLLGITQGLTEFLPVSSSGHLVLLQKFFGIKKPELLFDICLHAGTMVSVCIVFFHEIQTIFMTLIHLPGLTKSSKGFKNLYIANENVRITVLIIAGSLPTAVFGIFFYNIANSLFNSITCVGVMLIITGIILWATRLVKKNDRLIAKTTLKDALIIGLVQGLAIIPGLSRSGSTISMALFLGIDRKIAGRYSFLLSIPAISGALVISLTSSAIHNSISWIMIIAGTFAAGIVGYGALVILLKLISRGRLYFFAPYCFILGIVALFFGRL